MDKRNEVRTKKAGMNKVAVLGAVFVILVAGFFIVKGLTGSGAAAASTGDLLIAKSDVNETAKFYPYSIDGVDLEVLAVKASDGTIRTAFNTCQVCYSSGRGYYEMEGQELVCQNCGNRFTADQVGLQSGGCNPVPITDEYKAEEGGDIVITRAFLEQVKDLFANWKANS